MLADGSFHPVGNSVPQGVTDVPVHDQNDDRNGPLGVLEEIQPAGDREQGHICQIGQGGLEGGLLRGGFTGTGLGTGSQLRSGLLILGSW